MGGCTASREAAPADTRILSSSAASASGSSDSRNLRVKLVLLGDSGVGKSCIVLRFVRGQFDPKSKVTVGAAFLAQTVALPDGATVKFEIWDTAGQERYASLAPLYYRGASAAAVVYDVTNADSFRKAGSWVKELQKHAAPGIVIALVGNKVDMEDKREVSREEAAAFAAANNLALSLETSAKTADGVSALFTELAAKLPRTAAAAAAAAATAAGAVGGAAS